ncbi:MAG: 5'-methylthioadenosine/adenosylhomocysteine nucleosidase [Lachnospiraceae bacterium]|nr:5'-methylthioadenosine/adenosylhomocysteine nucleosidase [Lachnospiraceae bacterium]
MSGFGKIGVIGAMDSETAQLIAHLEGSRKETFSGLDLYIGTMHGKEVTVVKCGIGKVNAARTAQLLIDRFEPDAIVNSGIAGGTDPELSVGDTVVASGLLQHDFDLTAIGCVRGAMAGGDRTLPTIYPADERLVEALFTAAVRVSEGKRGGDTGSSCIPDDTTIARGIIATGDIFVADSATRHFIWDTFSASATEMEGGAIAQVCSLSGIPFAVLRVLSDTADGDASESFDAFEQKTADRSAAIIEEFISLL